MKPQYDFFLDSIKFHWNNELEALFQQIKTSVTKDVILTSPDTKHPFSIFVDTSLNGIGCVSFQINNKVKLDVTSYNEMFPIFCP